MSTAIPLVSICIPTYNGAEFLVETLNSCRIQDYPNLELVISDDGSVDSTLLLVEKFTSNFPYPVKIVKHRRKGIGANWNNCIAHARGKYVKLLFQDDLLEFNCVTVLVKLIESRNDVGLVACKRHILIEGGGSNEAIWYSKYSDLQKGLAVGADGVYKLRSNDFNFDFFYIGSRNKIGEPSTILFKKECVSIVGEFREDLRQDLDFEYWWRVMDRYSILITSSPLASFRLHGSQQTNANKGRLLPDYFIIKRLILTKYIWKMSARDIVKVVKREFYLLRKIVGIRFLTKVLIPF